MSYLINMDRLTEEEQAQRQSLEAKRLTAIESLGDRWVLSKQHAPTNNGAPVGLLDRANASIASHA